eukprot:gb/GECG01005635.1/.p1 GENE.gb/GECG01005635.1/~~gb/GECG01005635.1/.p1  ORF type:complete len:291 (+),score=48.10 gb/GECG01005635.1/:1-873(+)
MENTHIDVVGDRSKPLPERMRAVFYCRTDGSPEAISALCRALEDQEEGSVLFRHEVAFALGQIQNPTAIPCLTKILENTDDDPIVRHECAEALGAIGDTQAIGVISNYVKDDRPEVSETCQIALQKLKEDKRPNDANDNPYESVDPAPPESSERDVAKLQQQLLDKSSPLYNRYKAMFALRNRVDKEGTEALLKGLQDDSALFRHEVAYVLGQLQNSSSLNTLEATLRNKAEHPMVRHEAAEALGAIGTEEALSLLREFENDDSRIVAESCFVALDAAEYWQEQDQVAAD